MTNCASPESIFVEHVEAGALARGDFEGHMPLYEYECRDCGHHFEAFVSGAKLPACPKCHSENLQKLLSVFGVGASSSSSASVGRAGGGCGSSGGG